jgi:hypothetical protein
VPGAAPDAAVNFGTAVAATGDWLLVGKQVVGAGRMAMTFLTDQ